MSAVIGFRGLLSAPPQKINNLKFNHWFSFPIITYEEISFSYSAGNGKKMNRLITSSVSWFFYLTELFLTNAGASLSRSTVYVNDRMIHSQVGGLRNPYSFPPGKGKKGTTMNLFRPIVELKAPIASECPSYLRYSGFFVYCAPSLVPFHVRLKDGFIHRPIPTNGVYVVSSWLQFGTINIHDDFVVKPCMDTVYVSTN